MNKRRLTKIIEEDLISKMVLLAGPRQCGKTTIANQLIDSYDSGSYYNWDSFEHRSLITKSKLDEKSNLWVFDELHKYKLWRNWLKGIYDLNHRKHKILVTGSAKLDVYSRGGDSLQGRYFFHRLHPFTLSEFINIKTLNYKESLISLPMKGNKESLAALEEMMSLGAFPEPLLSSSERSARRWRRLYGQRLIREDITSLEIIKELDKIELLYEQLPTKVASPLSINSLREDLEVSFESVRHWIKIFERNYACFRVPPFGAPKIRAVRKEQKLYMWDHCLVTEESCRFENLIAIHLLRLVNWFEDVEGIKLELRYFRDTRKHEVDFVLVLEGKPWIAIEVKKSARDLDGNLKYLLSNVQIPYAYQIHLYGDEYYRVPDINGSKVMIIPAHEFLVNLP